jgi:hypothetical protein
MADVHYSAVGKCIYCGETNLAKGVRKFGDEHIIPLAMGGNLILDEASCDSCEKIINSQIETPVLDREWGQFRARRGFPTRHKKQRKEKTHVIVGCVDGTTMKVPLREYSCPVMLYKFGEARILSGLPYGTDHLRWTASILTDHETEMAMQEKYPQWNKRHRLKTQPHEFARLLAKIGYSYATAELGYGAFTPLVTDLIRGTSDDYFLHVGGSWDMPAAVPGGDHLMNISMQFTSPTRALVILAIRLFSAMETPNYHAVVGAIDLTDSAHAEAWQRHIRDGKIPPPPASGISSS